MVIINFVVTFEFMLKIKKNREKKKSTRPPTLSRMRRGMEGGM